MSAPCILTIEDDPAIRRGIVVSLNASGHVVWQADRADTIEKHQQQGPRVARPVLPGGHGLTCLLRYESKTHASGHCSDGERRGTDRVKGLRLGADDYVDIQC